MKYRELIDKMTLEEKAGLTSGMDFWHTKPIPRLGIPSMLLSDGPHGLRKQEWQSDHLGMHKSVPATCFPTAASLANSWDTDMIERLGRALGLEAASEGISVLLGPGCNIKRNPLCGRNFEYFSEDPYLSGKSAAALIRGVQSNGISACVKHFAANSQELRRMSNDSVVDERTLREIYLPSFEMAVKEGGVKCVMTSYNRLNGEYTNENTHLLQDILYGEWGYDGMVVTDWGGNNDRVKALVAGDNLEMPYSGGDTDRYVAQAVRDGVISEELLDERVDKILDMVFTTRKAFDYKHYDKQEHHRLAAEFAEETAVLLKNDGILPLAGGSVAVIGDFAKTPRYQGAGSSLVNSTRVDNALDALRAEGVRIVGFEPGYRRGGGRSSRLCAKACELAMRAETVLLFLGLDEGGEAEGIDRSDMRLPENQLELLTVLSAVSRNIVVILSCGGAVEMPWQQRARAVVHGFLGGQAGATAMARLLTGKANFSGKLSETIPLRYEDMPSAPYYPGREKTSEYREGLFVGYRYFDTAQKPVLYPFGYGLSYTQYRYSDLEISGDTVSFSVENTGKMSGAEVAQLYIAPKTNGTFRPARELKGFVRITLAPKEKKRAEITLSDRSFALWSTKHGDWVVEAGEYEILVGASSRDIRLHGTVTRKGITEKLYDSPELAPYYTADIKDVPDAAFEALLGRPIPQHNWDREAPFEFNDCVSQGEYLKGGLRKAIYNGVHLVRNGLLLCGKKMAANNFMYILDVPYRNIARMTEIFNDEQVYALLKVVNREKGGVRAFINATKERKLTRK
ncbi:MAG TPA: glycosyl hydrolase [Clostridiales bacterium]|nr:glycosyl hydrolase [Clostridiales bacterium]